MHTTCVLNLRYYLYLPYGTVSVVTMYMYMIMYISIPILYKYTCMYPSLSQVQGLQPTLIHSLFSLQLFATRAVNYWSPRLTHDVQPVHSTESHFEPSVRINLKRKQITELHLIATQTTATFQPLKRVGGSLACTVQHAAQRRIYLVF